MEPVKNILLCVTGSVAAYKAISLSQTFKRHGKSVKVIMTEAATKFFNPYMFQALGVEVFTDQNEWSHNGVLHVELAKWADVILICPATANTIAKIAHGFADNLLTSVVLARRGITRIVICPAMNTAMWENTKTVTNIMNVRPFYQIIEPTSKTLACGDTGAGALANTKDILYATYVHSHPNYKYEVIISAGNTSVGMDAFRSITNIFRGKTGADLADQLCINGVRTLLLTSGEEGEIAPVRSFYSFQDLMGLSLNLTEENKNCIFVASAAVSDYAPLPEKGKVRSDKPEWIINLKPLPKIISAVRENNPKLKMVTFKALPYNEGLEDRVWKEEYIKAYNKIKPLFLVGNLLKDVNGKGAIVSTHIVAINPCVDSQPEIVAEIKNREDLVPYMAKRICMNIES